MRQLGYILIAASTLAACDKPYDPGAPVVDPNAPRLHILTPTRGTFAGAVDHVTVTGESSDDVGVAGIQVNGVDASIDETGHWTATVPVAPGTTLLHAIAVDAQGNQGKETRAVVTGPTADIADAVPEAITASLSAQTFDAIGRGAAGFLKTGDLEAIIAPHNPVIDYGNGPDCLYVQGAITSIHIGNATTVGLTPRAGGLYLDAELDHVVIGMHLNYAAACIDGSRDITIAADHVKVAGMMTVAVAGGAFDIHLDDPDVVLTHFDVDLGGVPGAIVDLLHIDTAMGPIIGWATEKFVTPVLNRSLAGLNSTKTMDVLGTPVDVKVAPARIDFSSAGAIVELDTTLRAHGDDASPGYVYVANETPAMDVTHGFELAVADDAANQLLGSYWAAKGLDRTFDLTTGSYGEVGTLYDAVQIQAAVPPFIDASGSASESSLKLTIGDLVATFKNGGAIATQVVINAEAGVKVVTNADGTLKLDVGTPTTYVDILDENVDGANELSNAAFEAITSFALSRVVAVGSGTVGAIPLPSIGGVGLQNVSVDSQTGYLVVDGEVQ